MDGNIKAEESTKSGEITWKRCFCEGTFSAVVHHRNAILVSAGYAYGVVCDVTVPFWLNV
jgi:hypothetical protein